jgi:hypothetical protein
MRFIVMLLAVLATMQAVQAEDLFRWVDKAGKLNYGDSPPADASEVERLKFSGNATQDADLPYETRRAQENFPVTLYVGNDCGDPCAQGSALLSKRGIPYSEKLLQTREDLDAFKRLSGISGAVPVLQVGKDFLKGFSASQWNGELDIAGYPKTAGYRQRLAPQVKPEPFTPPAEDQAAPAPAR